MIRLKILILTHYYYPDDVVSSRLFQELCEDLAQKGWDIEVWPCNRNHHDLKQTYAREEFLNDVKIKRIWRFPATQSLAAGRILNSIWMISTWLLRWFFYGGIRPQAVLIGSDPVLALLTAIGIRAADSKVKIIHWCFDLYPEAAVADGRIKENSFVYRISKRLMGKSYQACDLIADLGICMRRRLTAYPSHALRETLAPWAFYEPAAVQPPDSEERSKLFGDTSLGILYSGNFGLAHSAELTLKLACDLSSEGIRVCFSVRGNSEKVLREHCAAIKNPVRFADFVSEDRLEKRLEAADIHIVSLKENWTGTVVPSKFFGAIATGRPVIFEGSRESAIAGWISNHQLGWVLNAETLSSVAEDLKRLSKNPAELKQLQNHCQAIYQQFFARSLIVDKWDRLLQQIIL